MGAKQKSELEFIALMAFLMANAALAIDAVLPGLNGIGASLNVTEPNDLQLIVTMILVGLGVGQLFFGTLSDSFGRKPMVYAGAFTFIIASLICVWADSLAVMLIGRVLQGMGLSAPRSISVSIIRDSYSGNNMARIMSFITGIFIIVPMLAPLIGQFILDYYTWEYIFGFQIVFILLVMLWFSLRQEETLKKEDKKRFSRSLFMQGARTFFGIKNTVIYTLISGLMGGAFFVYLSASKQIFQDQYGLTNGFGYVFGALAFSMGVASFLNSSLVLRFGMKKLATYFLVLFSLSSATYSLLFFNGINPNLWVIMVFFAIQFLALGFIFGNVRSLAMEPIGHIAGVGAAINGFMSTLMSVPIAIFIGSFITTSALPVFLGFLCCSLLSLMLMLSIHKRGVEIVK
ncbi:Bcr/CflA family drug resistance efflux transporter [Putridiphycobacter roseus]|uniref:Bcr/CflA family drug resistance efflux transporter n=1 Tax=Putridiphycobacter roseus TaxID=2219161 RepID=A0A2W1N2P7_9FLAO|nr:multidrug effflux MFS transporter [Putridiphycobacter roseus]PZE18134.1 Bcr/CflA family drug resistance efflux transporter [Putridiphycobacter roseus]